MAKGDREYFWEMVLKVPRCHRWFRGVKSDGTQGVAVCDESGSFPEETDDGVIWLDEKMPMLIESNQTEEDRRNMYAGCFATIYGRREDGSPAEIGGTNGQEVMYINQRFPKTSVKFKAIHDNFD